MKGRDDLPQVGLVAWYVGAGDSFTLLLGKHGNGVELVAQVDLNHLTAGEDDDDPHVPVIDQLVEILPVVDGRPYLAVFTLTHPDQDHCRGFAKLLDEVLIGELWVTPRIFEEYKSDLCDDATKFREEADRRLPLMCKGDAASGDRIRVVGGEELFDSKPYSDLPDDARSPVGSDTTVLDGQDAEGTITATFLGPLEVDADTDRNDTSLAMRVALTAGDCEQRILFLGDLAHESLGELLKEADSATLEFDVLIAPHHCSKRALFDENGDEASEVTDGLKQSAADDAWVVASSPPIPAKDTDGADPPHRVAWDKYEEIFGADNQVCTGEHGNEKDPDPVVFEVGGATCGYVKPSTAAALAAAPLVKASSAARPRSRPTERRGYGPVK